MSEPSEATSANQVPRRVSPWGRPEGDKREPVAHRCNNRVEDVIQALFEGNPLETVPGPWKLMMQCFRSKKGEEPLEPYTYLKIDPPKREEPIIKDPPIYGEFNGN
ncbi:hypothetical protein H6P81_007014 [Aristolochia fimbriata]|uniref:Uncharacterized protein n=1 Tax=Aristolochia fimbriata TaxID=158543 RepID=A0AAV7EYY1_ARIFI|nr:hypothetical protein H6P81_007014 [Aristolochia fimbriata]